MDPPPYRGCDSWPSVEHDGNEKVFRQSCVKIISPSHQRQTRPNRARPASLRPKGRPSALPLLSTRRHFCEKVRFLRVACHREKLRVDCKFGAVMNAVYGPESLKWAKLREVRHFARRQESTTFQRSALSATLPGGRRARFFKKSSGCRHSFEVIWDSASAVPVAQGCEKTPFPTSSTLAERGFRVKAQ